MLLTLLHQLELVLNLLYQVQWSDTACLKVVIDDHFEFFNGCTDALHLANATACKRSGLEANRNSALRWMKVLTIGQCAMNSLIHFRNGNEGLSLSRISGET